ncbi:MULTISPECIES: ORC-CDC6 family AAA ATPase [Heyndrickxia]|uniref:ORC-CDC6 family AAA ATPase n=1 Tax=Heyndrickxia TaxID=2837504 RepID=UPI0015C60261|nr:hypothetical protein [Heyndrickxia coagulans]
MANIINHEKVHIKEAFESILRADYISIDGFDQLETLEKYYIDIFNNTSLLLQKQDNYISGRRGTGKTTLLLRGYYECLKTISPKLKEKKHNFGSRKVLPIYIDLTTCNEIFDSENRMDLIEIHFIREMIASLKSQLEVMFDEKYLFIFKKENPVLDDLEFIEKVLVKGLRISTSKTNEIVNTEKETKVASAKANLKSEKPEIGASLVQTNEDGHQEKIREIRGLNIQDFIRKVAEIKRKAGLDSIYVFIDEYSDLNEGSQNKFSMLIKNLFGNKINMFFKIGVITDRFSFGERIILGRDLYPIPLDLNEHVEQYDGVTGALKKLEEYIGMLIEKRLSTFCSDLNYSDLFSIRKDLLCRRLARASLGVTRTIGWILQTAWTQCQLEDGNVSKIGLQDINFGIRSARKMYFKQFQGSIKGRLIPGFYMDLWNKIIEKALNEKSKFPDRPASHILIDPVRKDYLNMFCENFLLNFLEEGRASKAGGNYNLYSIDYDICNDNNIKYAEDKDEFTAIRFIYDSVLSEFDPYFIKDKIKSYKCPKCGRIYDESEVAHVKVKRCHDDDERLEEIIHKETPRTAGNYVEVEIKILGLINGLTESEAMTAQDIANVVGCSRQKVSNWGAKVLAKKGLINIIQKDGKNHYYGNEDLIE